ncbi:MAG TPA: hypothetical protein VLV86_22715 [Vicinamibacterales bacterium]|nr:hypothetical protein [Vicinamibacterales bacterium]
MHRFGIAAILTVTAVSVSAQWLKTPTPQIPRDSNGKALLTAPAPRAVDGHPDLSGLWQLGIEIGYAANITADLGKTDVQPWAEALSRSRLEEFGKDDPEITGCKPGGPRHITRGGLSKIIQTPNLIVILFEDLSYRQIFLDGREMPKDPNPTWMGYSIGRWDGNTLVIETSGFNDRTWLDFAGHPHSEALKMTERFRRRDFGHLELQVALDDPTIYAKPITLSAGGNFVADTDLIEFVCENEKDRVHLIGRTAQEKTVVVPREVLATYVGVYDVTDSRSPIVGRPRQVFTVTLDGNQLLLDMGGKGKIPMIPLSQTSFSPRLLGTYEFVKDGSGRVTHMLVHSAEEVLTARRR